MSDDQPSDETFATLFAQSQRQKRRAVHAGDRVSGRVVSIGQRRVLLDLGDGLDGMIELAELGEHQLKVGDAFEGFALRVENRVVEVGRALGKSHAGRLGLEHAAKSGIPVEGVVKEVNKGGYVVEIGASRAFCPLGQMDLRRIEEPETMIGKRLAFRVTEAREDRDPVLSRRALLAEEQQSRATATREKLAVGARFRGPIVSVRDFGAFVDLGGLEGLVPASELAYGHQKPQDVVSVGQEVEVLVTRIEPGDRGDRISLSMRALATDPWHAAMDELPVGIIVKGKVQSIKPFGAFIELVPGVEGLLHVSASGRATLKAGQDVIVKIDKIELGEKRISLGWVEPDRLVDLLAPGVAVAAPRTLARVLGMTKTAPPPEPRPAGPSSLAPLAPAPVVGQLVEVTVDKAETFGVFVRWPGGRGLVHIKELGMAGRSAGELKRSFPAGSTFKAVITDIRPDGKINLSKTATERAEEREQAEVFMRSQAGSGLGTLGDLLAKQPPQEHRRAKQRE